MLERKERSKDVFKYIERFMGEIVSKYVPVLIVDELQVIKPLQGLRGRGAEPHRDVKIDELLIYKLFNFFVRLTKELHLCHIFAVTSDSLFIERVFNEAMLHGRRRYVLVDDFDYAVSYERLVDSLKKFADAEEIGINELNEVSKRYMVKENILFVEPLRKRTKEKNKLLTQINARGLCPRPRKP